MNAPLTPQELKIFYESTFFSSIIEMDYNCPSLTRIFRHVSWECTQRSQEVVMHILDQFRSITKIPIHARIMDPLLSLNDSLKMKRILWCVSPYKVTSGRITTGLLGIMRNLTSDDKHTQFLVHFLLYLSMRTREESNGDKAKSFSVYFYLLQRKSELYWMKDFLVTKLDSTNEPVPKAITQEEASAAEALLRANPPGQNNNVVDAKNLYIVVCKLIEYSSTLVEHPHWSTEEEFFQSCIEALQDSIKLAHQEQENLNNRIQNIHNYYRSKCPEIQPPPELSDDEHGNSSWISMKAKTDTERSVAAQQGMGLGAQRNSRLDRAIVPYVHDSETSHNFPRPQRPSQPLPATPNLSRPAKPALPMRTHGPTTVGKINIGNQSSVNTQASGENMHSSEFNNYSQSPDSPTSPSDIPSLEPAPVQGPSHPEFGGPIHPSPTTVVTVPPIGEPDDADSLVASLKEMMGDHLSSEVVKLALINSSWNPDRAAENLFDENKVKMYTREVEEKRAMEKNGNSEKGDGKRGGSVI